MKEKTKIILAVIISITSTLSITAFAVFRASASNITFSSDKTDKENVEESLNELYDLSENCGGTSWCPNVDYPVCASDDNGCLAGMLCLEHISVPNTTKKCKRAKNLHTEKCTQTNTTQFCSSKNNSYNGTDIINGSTIVYGNSTITQGELHTGDALTCDVNGDGLYDEVTERFYYVSDLYTGGETGSETFDTDYAVLIYYNNTTDGIPDNTSTIPYNSANINNLGPITADSYLPTTQQWKKISLKSQTRQIYTITGTTSTTAGTLPLYTYTNKAARLITSQEINKACGITIGNKVEGEIDTPTCRFLLENTKYSNASLGSYGYWLEMPDASRSDFVWTIYGDGRAAYNINSSRVGFIGVRPVIEVLKTDIAY